MDDVILYVIVNIWTRKSSTRFLFYRSKPSRIYLASSRVKYIKVP